MNGIEIHCQALLKWDRLAIRQQLEQLALSNPAANNDLASRRWRFQLREKLKQIEAALARIDEGEFGICQACYNPISDARLLTLPYAELCLDCQQAKERFLEFLFSCLPPDNPSQPVSVHDRSTRTAATKLKMYCG